MTENELVIAVLNHRIFKEVLYEKACLTAENNKLQRRINKQRHAITKLISKNMKLKEKAMKVPFL